MRPSPAAYVAPALAIANAQISRAFTGDGAPVDRAAQFRRLARAQLGVLRRDRLTLGSGCYGAARLSMGLARRHVALGLALVADYRRLAAIQSRHTT